MGGIVGLIDMWNCSGLGWRCFEKVFQMQCGFMPGKRSVDAWWACCMRSSRTSCWFPAAMLSRFEEHLPVKLWTNFISTRNTVVVVNTFWNNWYLVKPLIQINLMPFFLAICQRNSSLRNISHFQVAGSSASLSDSIKLLGTRLSPQFYEWIRGVG